MVSYALSQGINKTEVNTYFELLEKNHYDNDLLCKPGHIFKWMSSVCK